MIPDGFEFIDREKIVIVDSSVNLQEVVIEYLKSDGSDFSTNAVVYPGRRPASYLRQKIAKKTKKVFIPPVIYSMDDFVLDLHRRLFRSKPIDSLDAIYIIYKICQERLWLSETFADFSIFLSLGQRILSLLEELYIEGVTLERLREIEYSIHVPSYSSNNFRFLSTIYSEFYKRIEDSGFCTRSKRYVELSERDDLLTKIDFERIIFVGFYALTNSERKILSKLSAKDGFFFIIQKEGEITSSNRRIFLYSAPDVHGEVKILQEILRKTEKIDDVLVVLPRSETLIPLIRHGISHLKPEDYNISLGYPLSRTPLFGFFMSLFDVVRNLKDSKVHIPTYLRFLHHPYAKNLHSLGGSEKTATILKQIENVLENVLPYSFSDFEYLEEKLPGRIANFSCLSTKDETIVRDYIKGIHANLFLPFLDIKSVKDFFRKCSEVIYYLSENSTASYDPFFYRYAQGFMNEFERAKNSLFGELVFESRDSYFNFFVRLISSSFFPFEGDLTRGLQILGFLETRNLKFKRVVFLDLNEGVFPDLTEDYFIPYKIRKILGLPTEKDREGLLYYYFNTLLCGAEEVHLLFVENTEIIRSRFAERIVWEMEKKIGKPLDDHTFIRYVNYKVSLSNVLPRPKEKNQSVFKLLELVRLSPTAIDDYLECGIRFYYKYVLGLKAEEEIREGIGRSDIGTIVHLALKTFFERKLNERILPHSLSNEEMSEILDEIFKRRYGSYLDGRAFLVKRQIEKRLHHVLDYMRKHASSDTIRVLSAETFIEEELYGAKFAFRIDLVQERNSKIEIIDFKTSGESSVYLLKSNVLKSLLERKDPLKPVKLQIPLYVLLYAKKFDLDPTTIRGFYFFLGQKFLNDKCILDPFSEMGIREGLESVKELTKSAISEIKDPSFPFSPPAQVSKVCVSCSFKHLCGTLWVKSWESR